MLYDRVYKTIKEYSLIPENATVICALSGGADSVCLADVLYNLQTRLGFTLECAHVNHNLRGQESDGDEQFVRDFCKKRGITLHVASIDVLSMSDGKSIEEAARDARYGFFEKLTKDNGKLIATAHTLNDNTETFFINLLRGSGGRGLCGIPRVRGNIIRPILDIKRDEIISHLDSIGQGYCTDSTNKDTVYLRNFIRHEIIPAFDKRDDVDIFLAVAKATENLHCDSEALEIEADRFMQSGIDELLTLSDAVLFRVLSKRLKSGFDITLDRVHFKKIKALLSRPSSKEQIRGDVFAINRKGQLEFCRLCEKSDICTLLQNGNNTFEEKNILIKYTEEIYSTLTKATIDCDKIVDGLYARRRKDGDVFISSKRKCTSKLKKLLINDGVPIERRDMLTVICDGGGNIVFVEGYGADARVIADAQTKNKICIEIQRGTKNA